MLLPLLLDGGITENRQKLPSDLITQLAKQNHLPRFNEIICKITLSQKGMILVLVPAIFQLIMFGIFADLLYQAEEETRWQTRAREALYHSAGLMNNLMEAVRCVGKYTITGDSSSLEGFDHKLARMDVEFSELRKYLSGNPQALQALDKSISTKRLVVGYLREATRLTDLGDKTVAIAELRKIGAVSDQFAQDLKDLRSEYQKIDDLAPQSQEQLRHFMLKVIIGGTILNVLGAFSLAYFFNQSTIARLHTLIDNSRRLQASVSLNPLVTGTDEIAALDQTFHEMALTITEASAKVRSLIENMPVGLVTITRTGLVEAINPKAEMIFQCSSHEAVGKPASILFVLKKEASSSSFVEQLLKQGQDKTHELQARRLSNGDLLPAEIAISNLPLDGELAYLVSVQDISERHEVERLKRNFMDMISHDLSSPLTSLTLTLKLLSTGAFGNLSGEAREHVSREERNCNRLIELVKSLLEFEKMGAGKLVFELEEFSVGGAINAAIEAVATSAAQNKIAIETPAIELSATGDKQRIHQVIVNLLSNAIKFAPPNTTIQVDAHAEADCILVEVCDSGPGIPDSEKDAIFEQFHQLRRKDSAHKDGTGLGLAICKAIIEGHNGAIGVKDRPDGGAVFWFSIPRRELAAELSI